MLHSSIELLNTFNRMVLISLSAIPKRLRTFSVSGVIVPLLPKTTGRISPPLALNRFFNALRHGPYLLIFSFSALARWSLFSQRTVTSTTRTLSPFLITRSGLNNLPPALIVGSTNTSLFFLFFHLS